MQNLTWYNSEVKNVNPVSDMMLGRESGGTDELFNEQKIIGPLGHGLSL